MNDFFIKRVDINKLTRDYSKEPLGLMEVPNKEDVRYLFFELKFSSLLIGEFFNKSRPTVDKWLHTFGFTRLKEDIQYSKELTLQYKYGDNVKCSLDIPGALDRAKKSNLKWGSNYHNCTKAKQTKKEKYGDENYNNKDKSKKTCLDKYGVDSYSKTQEYKDKKNNSLLDKYGRTNVGQFGTKEHNEAMIKKYGSAYLMQTDYGVNLYRESCKKHFGVNNYFQTQEYKDKYKDKEWVLKIKEKEYNTKKKNQTLYKDIKDKILQSTYNTKLLNHSFTTSKPEQRVLSMLLAKFPDTISPYRSDLYPYNCDFYIPSKDLYIEYQGTWTHGYEPFDKSNIKHLDTVNKWIEKSKEYNFKNEQKDYYKQAIYVWTDLDVRKREIAKQNNLNYKELWSLKEAEEWIGGLQ